MARIVGIDLGTTNSLVAYMDGTTPRVIAGRHGRTMVPSVVALTDNGLIVGDPAKEHLVRSPERTIYSIKRFMGKGLQDVAGELAYFPYQIHEKNGVIRIQLGEKSYSPPQVSAMILKELKQRAEAALGEEIRQAVITVPAYFNDSQRQATKDAGMIAGLEVLRIINEPTAASLAYGLQQRTQGTIAVYDLGGGTFDISIMTVDSGIFEVIATGGDSALGGEDWDRRMVERVADDLFDKPRVDLMQNPVALGRLREACEAAKKQLSGEREAWLRLPFVAQDQNGNPVNAERKLTRDEVEGWTKDLLEKLAPPCKRAFADAGLTPEDIVRAMAGRDVERESVHRERELGGAALRVEALSSGERVRDVSFEVRIENAPPGTHAVHVHETGDCSADDASSAGVRIRLNLHGTCYLRPGVRNVSQGVEVVSIVDRFLEHSRIFHFRNGGDEEVYLSSADWLPRNLDGRFELLFPVESPECRARVVEALDTMFMDNVKARWLQPDGTYKKRRVPKGEEPLRAQIQLYRSAEALRGRARAAARRHARALERAGRDRLRGLDLGTHELAARFREEEALEQVAAPLEQRVPLARRFDPLRDDADAHLRAECGHRRDEPLLGRLHVDVPHQGHVQLHDLGLEVGERRQPRVARPQVVDRDAIAELSERRDAPAHVLHVVERRPLRDLEDDPARDAG